MAENCQKSLHDTAILHGQLLANKEDFWVNKLTTLGEEVSEGDGSDPEDEDDIDTQQSDGDSGVFNRQFLSACPFKNK